MAHLPRQLLIPAAISSWSGIAMLDTGSSYTLINDSLWREVKEPGKMLKPWVQGPLYLADGSGKYPLGWTEMEVIVHQQMVAVPLVVLPTSCLAVPVVLGLDFVFFSHLQRDVSENTYWFKSAEHRKHLFLEKSISIQPPHVAFYSAVLPQQMLQDISSSGATDDILEVANQSAQLDGDGKKQLCRQLRLNADVCTTKVGQTHILTHSILLADDVPIRQKPYRCSPKKNNPKSHFCVDFRKVKAETQTDAYPIPNIQEILDSLAGSTVFTTIDLNSGYWQVPMDEQSKEKMPSFVHLVCSSLR